MVTTAAEQTYEDVKALIYDTANKFARNYGGDPEELAGDAHVIYCRSYKRFDPTRGMSFPSYVRKEIWEYLLDQYRVKRGRRIKKPSVCSIYGAEDDDCSIEPVARPVNRLPYDFFEGMTEDAATVARLALDPPSEVVVEADNKGGHINNFRASLRAYLHRLGWAAERITESFAEVGRVLVE